jgi:ABC-type oligopeptide transport system ATPase subunit
MPRYAEEMRTSVEYVEWEDFLDDMSTMEAHPWKRGQHVALIGKTGCGKTTLANALLPLRTYTVVIATKPKSESLDRFAKDNGYKIFQSWPKEDATVSPKRVLWPPMKTLGDVGKQRFAVGTALNEIYGVGKWCIYADELRYLTETLQLGKAIELFLMQGRELGISFIGAMQRPKFVPLSVYSMSTHLFFWQEKDINNLERISAINSVDSHFIANVVTELGEHEFLYIHSPTGYMCRSMAPDPDEGR